MKVVTRITFKKAQKVFLLLVICGAAIAGIFFFHTSENRAPLPQTEKPQSTGPARKLTGVDLVLIEKKAHRLTLYRKGQPLKTYRIALGSKPVGKKTTEGDCKTPEGVYTIDHHKANSRYHRALHISYPDAEDRRQAAERGVSPGGDVMIHGLPEKFAAVGALHVKWDWTRGCIAMTNEEIDELWQAVPDGANVKIVP